MRTCSLVLALLLSLAAPSGAQRQKIKVNLTTPEGRLLNQIGEESDAAKKVALMEQFLTQFPNHEGVALVYSQMVAGYTGVGQYDKALAAAEKALATDPADMQAAFAAVKAAEAKKDPDTLRKWAVQVSDLARKAAQAPKAADEDDDSYKVRVDAAKQVDTYTEYALYAGAAQSTDVPKRIELFKTLEERAPASPYAAQASGVYFVTLAQSGNMPEAVALADRLIARGQASEEMMAAAADFYLHSNKEQEKVLDYSSKLINSVNAKPKPDGVNDADWEKRKTSLLGWAQWMTGTIYCSQGKFEEADKVLREALPLTEGNAEHKGGTLYNLGVANAHLRKVAEASKFYEQCTALESPYQPPCAENLKAIRKTYRVVK